MDKVKKFVEDQIVNNKKLWEDVEQDKKNADEYKDAYFTWLSGLEKEYLLSWSLGICFLSEMSSLKLMRDVIKESMKAKIDREFELTPEPVEDASVITKEDMHSC